MSDVQKIKDRNGNIDAVKGAAALLVVIGHIIQRIICKEDPFENMVFRIIYSFHMPLFMFISGYLSYRKDFDFKWLLERVKRLLIPFFSWILIDWSLGSIFNKNINIIGLGHYFLEILIYPDKGYWFLLVLFYNCAILFVIEFLIKNIQKKTLIDIVYLRTISIILSVFICKCVGKVIGICGLGLLGWHSFFYFGGYWIKYISEKCKNFTNIITQERSFLRGGVLALFAILVIFWKFNDEPSFSINLYTILGNDMIGYFFCKIIIIIYKYIVPVLGILTSFILIFIFPIGHVKNFITICGRYTLEIYILQSFLIRDYTDDIIMDSIISFIFSIFISMGITKVIDQIPILNFICFGKSNKVKI